MPVPVHTPHALLHQMGVVGQFGLRTRLLHHLVAQVWREYFLVVEVHAGGGVRVGVVLGAGGVKVVRTADIALADVVYFIL